VTRAKAELLQALALAESQRGSNPGGHRQDTATLLPDLEGLVMGRGAGVALGDRGGGDLRAGLLQALPWAKPNQRWLEWPLSRQGHFIWKGLEGRGTSIGKER